MKTNRRHSPGGQLGGVLATTLLTTAVLATLVVGVLQFAVQEHRMEVRATSWNSALPVAEAGVEEAMSQLRVNGPGGNIGGDPGTLASAGWTLSDGVYSLNRTLNSNAYYQVFISSTIPPVVTSKGYYRAPMSDNYLQRKVQITTTKTALFTPAFAASSVINLNGNTVAADSYDSSNPSYSTAGKYDPTKTSTNGDIVSINGPVDLGNDTIKGDLYLGPTATWNGNPSQVSGTVYHDLNLEYPPVTPPTNFTSWTTASPANATIDGTTYKYAFYSSGDYTIPDSAAIYVAPNVNVRVRMTATTFSPTALRVAGTNSTAGKLTLYMAGVSSTLGGNTTIDCGNPANFIYFGLPSNTNLTYSGNSTLVAAIYAPNADLTLNGGGNNNGLIGSSITKSIKMNGHYTFHFDEHLSTLNYILGYTISSWKEL
jgi:hypothetical protein